MKNETARREIESLDYYLQNHTDDYSEESHTAMMMGIKALEQEPYDFARWVAREIFDDNWEYNKDANFAEIACRKLEKLGIVRAIGDEWELVEPQERSDKG